MLRVVVFLLGPVNCLAAAFTRSESGISRPAAFSMEGLFAGMELAFDSAVPEPSAATFVLGGIALILPGIFRKRNRNG